METKKTLFITIVFFFFCSISYAQLKVLSNGKVGIGTTNPQYGFLEIGKSGVNNGLAIYDSASGKPSFKLYTSGDYAFLNFGVKERGLAIQSNGRFAIGANLNTGYEYPTNALLNLYIHPSNYTSALMAYANFPMDFGDVIKVYSNRHTDVAFVVRDITKNSTGEMTFYVNGDGCVYSKGSLLTASDVSFKDNINSINNSLLIIRKMRGVTYQMKEQSDNCADINTLNVVPSNSDTLLAQSIVSIDIINKIKAEKKRKKAGFIAQELEEVFPEAVYTLPNGKKAIAYSEIIPLLVEAIKEQQNEIDELKQVKTIQTRSAIGGDENEQPNMNSLMDERLTARLYSNIPNPFKEQTTISFFIPETASGASIHIYNLQGKQIKQINIEERGNGSVIINGYELTPGMYMYTLIVDGKEIDTKKMILTE